MTSKDDLAVLQQTMPTGMEGLKALEKFTRDGNAEIKKLLYDECDVLLECRYCRNIFRSVINYVSHKRSYCRISHVAVVAANAVQDDDGKLETATKKRIGQVGVLTKRLETTMVPIGDTHEMLALSTLPRIMKELPVTTIEEGLQKIVGSLPAHLVPREVIPDDRVVLTMPQDNSSKYKEMLLRARKAPVTDKPQTREFTHTEIKIIESFEKHDVRCGDFVKLECDHPLCSHIKPFHSLQALAYHCSLRHTQEFKTEAGEIRWPCLLCCRHMWTQDGVRTHMTRVHQSVKLEHLRKRTEEERGKPSKKPASRVARSRSLSLDDSELSQEGQEKPRNGRSSRRGYSDAPSLKIEEELQQSKRRGRSRMPPSSKDSAEEDDGEEGEEEEEEEADDSVYYDSDPPVLQKQDEVMAEVPEQLNGSNGADTEEEEAASAPRAKRRRRRRRHFDDEASETEDQQQPLKELKDIKKEVKREMMEEFEPKEMVGLKSLKDIKKDIKLEMMEQLLDMKEEDDEMEEMIIDEEIEDEDEGGQVEEEDIEDEDEKKEEEEKEEEKKEEEEEMRKMAELDMKALKQWNSVEGCLGALIDDVCTMVEEKKKKTDEGGEKDTPPPTSASSSQASATKRGRPKKNEESPAKAGRPKKGASSSSASSGGAGSSKKKEDSGEKRVKRAYVRKADREKMEAEKNKERKKEGGDEDGEGEEDTPATPAVPAITPDAPTATRPARDRKRPHWMMNNDAGYETGAIPSFTPKEESGHSRRSSGKREEDEGERRKKEEEKETDAKTDDKAAKDDEADKSVVPSGPGTSAMTPSKADTTPAEPEVLLFTPKAGKFVQERIQKEAASSSRKRKQNLGKIADDTDDVTIVSVTDPSNGPKRSDLTSVPVYLSEHQQRIFFAGLIHQKSSDNDAKKDFYECMYCKLKLPNVRDGRRHMVAHLRVMRLRCGLCGAGSFFCIDMRNHLQMRGCPELAKAPQHMIKNGTPCMTKEHADELTYVAHSTSPGRAMFTSGKIVSIQSNVPHLPDPVIEEKILGPTRVPPPHVSPRKMPHKFNTALREAERNGGTGSSTAAASQRPSAASAAADAAADGTSAAAAAADAAADPMPQLQDGSDAAAAAAAAPAAPAEVQEDARQSTVPLRQIASDRMNGVATSPAAARRALTFSPARSAGGQQHRVPRPASQNRPVAMTSSPRYMPMDRHHQSPATAVRTSGQSTASAN